MIKISLSKMSLMLIIPFSGFYITKLPISPIYITFLGGATLSGLLLIKTNRIKMDSTIVISFSFIMYLLFSQFAFSAPNVSAFSNFVFSLICFIIASTALCKEDTITILGMSEKLVYFSLPLLIYEAYYRISHPVYFVDFAAQGREDLEFYFFKMNSVMYQDSNFVGIFIVTLFFFTFYLKQYTNKKYYVSLFLLATLVLLTLSRSSIFSLAFCLLLYPFRKLFYTHIKKVIFILICIIILVTPILFDIKSIDDSFSTKFTIFQKTIDYLSIAPLKLKLFGVGFGNAVEVLGIGAHNFFVTYLVESGLIGLIFVVILWIVIIFKTRFKAGVVIFPFLLNGMSLTSGAIPYLYSIFAVILTLESRRGRFAR